MRAIVDRVLTQLREYFGRMSRRSRIALVILALAVIALAIVAATLLGRTKYVTLYNAQDAAEAGRLYTTLQDMGVPARVVEGTRVLVPENRVGELGAVLSTIGPGMPNIDIMSMAASFNVTESHARKLYEVQRAQEIKELILRSNRIQDCNVIVNMGQTSAFVRPTNTNQPMVTVMLIVRGGITLSRAEAQTIAEAVRTAVPGTEYENITIIDESLYTYRIGNDSEDFDIEVNSRYALQNLLSQQMQEQGLQMLTPIFGMSNIEVTARVVLNFDKESIERIEYAPPVIGETEGIPRSTSDLWEAARGAGIGEGIPGTDPNGMGSIEYPYGTLDEGDIYLRRLIERNNEINQTIQVIEKEVGSIRSIHLSVAMNETEIPEDYSEQVADLISTGMGIPLYNVSVQRFPFQTSDDSFQQMFDDWAEYEEQQRQSKLVETIIMWAVILLLGIALFTLIGMIARGGRQPEEVPVLAEGEYDYDGIDYIVDDEYGEEESQQETEDIELVKKSTGLEQIERFIDKDPAAVAQLLRNWLVDD